ncbi:DUF1344 domain-containing protein [Roseibium sediminicola]|uniref:DUF1344 domain-containing protein n=1 Tax=Roseibium sediminicola TaxID=2933272 RepID=A0ABT0GT72_9HYPH|nr:DUF1344 domain-containing protein [Roseibium sp. CAU 1639]MCK7612629.1 DUF1344 domain-containing protein [Roseibium sp. CAU 1639]
MTKWLIALMTACLLTNLPPVGATHAHADEVAGTILSIDPFNSRFALEDGTEFQLVDEIAPEELMIGMEVLVIFTASETGALVATALEHID